MSRLSFRPRPLDIHKKLPIVKSIKDFEDDDLVTTTATRNSQLQRIVVEADNEVRFRKFKPLNALASFHNSLNFLSRPCCRFYVPFMNIPSQWISCLTGREQLGFFVAGSSDSQQETCV